MKKFCALIVFLFSANLSFAQESKFIDLVCDENHDPIALRTATVTYKNKEGKTVDLIAVIHIGDKQYYRNQVKQFKKYDKLCYELVAPKEAKPTRQASLPWKIAKSFLQLEHQLEHVDYNAKNFIHADLEPKEISEILKKRGENEFSILLKVIMELAQNPQQKQDEINLEKALEDSTYLKRKLALQLSKGDVSLGKTLDQLIVKDRNEKAMEVVKEQLKTHKNIGLYYGAAHMPDFDKRLKKIGFENIETKWHVAWDLE